MRIGIAGYGSVGKSVEKNLILGAKNEIVGVFSNRDPGSVKTLGSKVYSFNEAPSFVGYIDCMILCYGASVNLWQMSEYYSSMFNTVDSFDNHNKIKDYKNSINETAKKGKNTSLICCGWDPGLMSVIRLYLEAFSSNPTLNTFWGEGISRGHTEAIRSIKGVVDAVQLTVPRGEAIERAHLGEKLTNEQRHSRKCFVCAEKKERDSITNAILSKKEYFEGYETQINYVAKSKIQQLKAKDNHRGRLILNDVGVSAEFDLKIDSNSDFTAKILIATARAAKRMNREGSIGAYTVADVPPSYYFDGETNIYKYI